MDITKAIEILKAQTHYAYKVKNPDLLNSLALGIEALRYIQRSRFFGEYPVSRQLSGERKETNCG